MPAPINHHELIEALQLGAADRYAVLRDLHRRVFISYYRAVQRITGEQADAVSSDGRAVKLVVGHIMEWDRFVIMGCGEILSGLKTPRLMKKRGFLSLNGEESRYKNIDDFNASRGEEHQSIDWRTIQDRALRSSEVLYFFFTNPMLMNAEILESTDPVTISDGGAQRLDLTVGWLMWKIVLEHEGFEHAPDLY
jgi:hypothetical protein